MYLNRLIDKGIKESGYWDFSIPLPNCTTYVLGEYLEQGGERKVLFKGRKEMGFPNAKNFYDDWLGAKGKEPRIGGFAVWGSSSAQYGHTAYIYGVRSKNGGWEIDVSQSNYGGEYFELKTYFVETGKKTTGVGFPYIGCCYNSIDDKRVSRNEKINQVEVKATNLKARKSPNGEEYKGLFIPVGIYNYTELKHEGDYDWVKVDNVWFALGDWAVLYSTEDELSVLREENSLLKKELETLRTESKKKDATLQSVKQYVDLIKGILK